jgi:hypothetical protein
VQQLLQACRVATPIAIHESLPLRRRFGGAVGDRLNELLYLHEMRQARFFVSSCGSPLRVGRRSDR